MGPDISRFLHFHIIKTVFHFILTFPFALRRVLLIFLFALFARDPYPLQPMASPLGKTLAYAGLVI